MNSTRSVAIVALTFVLGWNAAVAETLVVRAARMLNARFVMKGGEIYKSREPAGD